MSTSEPGPPRNRDQELPRRKGEVIDEIPDTPPTEPQRPPVEEPPERPPVEEPPEPPEKRGPLIAIMEEIGWRCA